MVSNVTSLESLLLLVTVSLPTDPTELLVAVKRTVDSQPTQRTLPPGILVDAGQNQFLQGQQEVNHLQQFLIGLREYGPVAVFGLPRPLESLFKLLLSSYDDTNFPLYFVENQEDGIAVIHHLQAVTSIAISRYSPAQSIENDNFAFRNVQTEEMFHAFIADPALYRQWRTIIDALYEDGEIAFETEQFAKLHEFGDVDDLTIDWDKIIMTLWHDVDL